MDNYNNNKTTIGAHDPTIIFDDKSQKYYMYSTDTEINGVLSLGVQIRESCNMKHWVYKGTALNGIPEWTKNYTNASNLWAPEVIYVNGKYRMYYSASMFGTNQSCIGLAESKEPLGPWEDKGLVINTDEKKDSRNSIDANVLLDRNNNMWMVYGSFFSGIYILRLNNETGLPLADNDLGVCIAQRELSTERAIEGPFIYYSYEYDYYYLFTSYDFLGTNYNIRVARSKEITGPYYDIKGNSMLSDNENSFDKGTKILGSYQLSQGCTWSSIGHNSIFDHRGQQYLVAHTRMNNKPVPHYAFIKNIVWLESGWPIISLMEWFEEISIDISNKVFHGIIFRNETTDVVFETAFELEILKEYKLGICKSNSNKRYLAVAGIDNQDRAVWGYVKEKDID